MSRASLWPTFTLLRKHLDFEVVFASQKGSRTAHHGEVYTTPRNRSSTTCVARLQNTKNNIHAALHRLHPTSRLTFPHNTSQTTSPYARTNFPSSSPPPQVSPPSTPHHHPAPPPAANACTQTHSHQKAPASHFQKTNRRSREGWREPRRLCLLRNRGRRRRLCRRGSAAGARFRRPSAEYGRRIGRGGGTALWGLCRGVRRWRRSLGALGRGCRAGCVRLVCTIL